MLFLFTFVILSYSRPVVKHLSENLQNIYISEPLFQPFHAFQLDCIAFMVL